MKYLVFFIIILVSCSSPTDKKSLEKKSILTLRRKADLSDPNNKLSGKIETLELEYISWGCACANWIESSKRVYYENNEQLSKNTIFIEPENKNLELPIYFDPARHQLILKGQFYAYPDYPKGTPETEEPLEKAKVFRYSAMKIIEFPIDFSKKEEKTLVLNYDPIACECPKWINNNSKEREHYFLERKIENLPDVDSLFDGSHLPIKIKVKGHFVSEQGYPKGFKPKKSIPKPAKVFQYNTVEILKH